MWVTRTFQTNSKSSKFAENDDKCDNFSAMMIDDIVVFKYAEQFSKEQCYKRRSFFTKAHMCSTIEPIQMN